MLACELCDEIAQIFTDTEMSRIKKAWILQINSWDFPGGPVVKNPPPKVGDTGSIPDWGRPHVPQGSSARAPQRLSLHPKACAPQREATAMRSLRTTIKSSQSAQPEKDCMQQQRPSTAKNKQKF